MAAVITPLVFNPQHTSDCIVCQPQSTLCLMCRLWPWQIATGAQVTSSLSQLALAYSWCFWYESAVAISRCETATRLRHAILVARATAPWCGICPTGSSLATPERAHARVRAWAPSWGPAVHTPTPIRTDAHVCMPTWHLRV